ncbi:hypothetical protein GCM10011611_11230 [Aliidongia dinghuensis]|uniref:DUF4347 domain-containing protein n=1 Tax=Aliidongia dinghuensis TaxID=1867774 RepID=A0A8J2YQJ6_9PROT|nr:hypothetical protein [Aliidongia dinghuensis]GGF07521.1 hypothetical protein GCM10011611_11230 [Aliidongia dinghuensis]
MPKPKKPEEKTAPTEITDAILVLDYDSETADSKARIQEEAGQIAKKVAGKAGRTVRLCKGADEFAAAMSDPSNKTLKKIHVVAHGNQAQVGNYNAGPLADWLAPLITNKNNLEKITLHSCRSAAAHPTSGEIFANQLAAALAPKLQKTQIKKLTVRGADGDSFTDSDGHNWVLNEGVKPEYRDTKSAEADFIKNNTVDRASARPKFTISRGDPSKPFKGPF